jgi:hypothetical protein
MTSEVIFENDELQVVWRQGLSDFLLITFGDLITPAEGSNFFAKGPATAADLSAVGFVAKTPNWYRSDGMQAAIERVRPIGARFQSVVAYGGSMGGYGAIKYSRALQASEVIAFCPQWSIDPEECEGQNPGWQDHLVPAMARMGIRADDVSGSVFVFSDMFDPLDRFHCQKIQQARPETVIINVPRVGHHITGTFAGTQTLLALIEASRAHNIPALRHLSRMRRAESSIRREAVLDRALISHPKLIAGLMEAERQTNPKYAKLTASQFFKDMSQHEQKNDVLGFSQWIDVQRARLIDPLAQALAAAILSQSVGSKQVYVTTCHGTTMVYSLGLGRCAHTKSGDASSPDLKAVEVECVGNEISLYIMVGGVRFRLGLHEDGAIGLHFKPTSTQAFPLFQMGSARNGAFTLKHGSAYVSAGPDGAIICNRPKAENWEYFRFDV